MPAVKDGDTTDMTGGRTAEALGAATESRLAGASRILNVPPGGPIVFQGTPAAELYCVMLGIVSVYRLMPDGRRQITGFLYPGDFLGITFNMEPTYGYSAEAANYVTLRAYARRDFERLLDESAEVRHAFVAKMADELTEAQDRMLLLGRRNAVERIAAFLVGLARRQNGGDAPTEGDVAIPMRWADIADYLGLSAETTSRTLKSLKERGVINAAKPDLIRIVDADALRALAGAPGIR